MNHKDPKPKDIEWLDKDFFLAAVQAVTEANPKAKKCLENRSKDPSDYMYLMYETLKFTGALMMDFGEADKLLKRKKDNAESQKFREEGNKVFLAKNDLQGLEESLDLYTKSIAFAIPNTSEMAKGFANRAAVLLRLDRPIECMEDIKRALNSDYPKELIPKLYIRKADCFSMLAKHSYIQAKFWLKQVPDSDPDRKSLRKDLKDYSTKDYKTTVDPENLPTPVIQSPHVEFPCASDAIDVEYFGPNGRKVIATRDIKVGEVLVVEKPYLSQLIENSLYAYCFECQQSFFCGIPCDTCPNVVYCSENCKLIAWEKYHNVECPVLNLLLQNNTEDTSVQLSPIKMTAALKLVIKFSREAGELNSLQERISQFYRCHDKKLESEWYKNQTLESLLTLDSDIKKISELYFQETTAGVIYTLFFLATTSNFLGNRYQRDRMSDRDIILSMAHNKNVQFVGGLLIQLFLLLETNHIMTRENLRSNFPNAPGLVIPSFLQVISLKCYFNTAIQFIGEHVILRSIAPIKTGEEVLHFLYSWILTPKEKRLSIDNWNTECSCRACEENWPTQEHLKSFEEKAKSPRSRATLKKVLEPLDSMREKIWMRNVKAKDYDNTLNIAKSMMEAIYEGVNLPCKEQLFVLNLLNQLYQNTISKRSLRQDIDIVDALRRNKVSEEFLKHLEI